MRRLPYLAALLGAATLAVGCSRAAQRPPDPRDGIEPIEDVSSTEPVVVYFVNSSTHGADVYAAANPRDAHRLGTVQPGSRARFELPAAAIRLGSTNVLARLRPSARALQTGTVTVNGGDVFTVSLTIAGNSLAIIPGRP